MKPKPAPPKPHSEIEIVRLIWLAIFVSVFSFLYYSRHGDVLLYGDAVAHINIARRLFDSRTPGLLQLGTVWLPLPHLLILPFILSNQMWQSGTGGSIPSMAGYVLGVIGIFRLVRGILHRDEASNGVAMYAPWAAAILYAANPNLIYMQSTAMGESLYLCFFIWALVFFAEFAVQSDEKMRSLTKCGLCLAGASWTRYDGWFLTVVLIVGALFVGILSVRDATRERSSRTLWTEILKFLLIAGAAPMLWLAYNAAVYGNALEFANGPYSAKAIAQKYGTVNPSNGNVIAAASYFMKAGESNIAELNWQQHLWVLLALVGSFAALFTRGRRWILLSWTPLPFYALSVAYGSVPIFIPAWWPFSYYNVRYGLQLLPAFVIFCVLGISFLAEKIFSLTQMQPFGRWTGVSVFLIVISFGALTDASIWRAGPVCYREAAVNSKGRVALDTQMASWLKSLPADSTLLMFLGEHVAVLEQSAIPLKRTINEGNHRTWKQPSDPDGLWEHALAEPTEYADFVIGFDGDPAWKAAQDHHLRALVEIHTTGQPRAAIFEGRALERR